MTDATLVSSSSATSLACHRSTSQRSSTARCRGGRCWRAATNASRTDSRATATSAGIALGQDEPVGHRLDPRHLRPRAQVLDDRLPRRPEIHRARPPLAAREHVEADVRRDAVEPRPERGAPLEAVDRLPGADERLLHRVLGLERRGEHAVAVGDQLPPHELELALELGGTGDGGSALHRGHATQQPKAGKGRKTVSSRHRAPVSGARMRTGRPIAGDPLG